MSLYLDYNSTNPIDKRVLDVMIDVYQNHIGNADSRTHVFGEDTRHIVETARKQVASLLGVESNEVFFTSGATESNNIAIQGLNEYACKTGKKHIITTSIEHKSVLETVKSMEKHGYAIDIINPNLDGRITVEDVISKLRPDTLLVSVMHVNNETGIIQPVEELGNELEKRDVLFHIDATQSCGKLVEEIKHIKYRMLTFSAHKIGGPQGIGCLVLRKKRFKLPPVNNIIYGGQQERGIRPGTIPVALVAGCGKACEIAENEYIVNEKKLRLIKDELYRMLENSDIPYHFNGNQKYCIKNAMNICFCGISSEALMIAAKQYCSISNGSACTSKSYAPSYVLSAMGIALDDINNSVRISWGPDTDVNRLKKEFENLIKIAKSLL